MGITKLLRQLAVKSSRELRKAISLSKDQSACQPKNLPSLHDDPLAEMVPTLGTALRCAYTRDTSISSAQHPPSNTSPISDLTLVLMSVWLSTRTEQKEFATNGKGIGRGGNILLL